MSSSLQGFCDEEYLNSRRSESKGESLGKSFYSLSFNFQKFQISLNFTQSITQQSNKQSIYLFILTFQNLEFWDVTEEVILSCFFDKRVKPRTLRG